MSPSKTACGSTPVQFSPPSPVCKNDCMHSTCNFGNLVCNLLSSLCLYCFTHPFLVMVFHFFEKMLPALAGEHDFEHCINAKSYEKDLLRPSNRTDYNHSGAVYGTWNLQKRWGNVYFLLMYSLWKLRLPLCVLSPAFWMTFSHFRAAFVIILLKNGPCFRKSHRTNM